MTKPKYTKQNYRVRLQEFVDQDYFDKLSDEEHEWLTQFNNEYYANDRPRKDQSDDNYLHKKEHIKDLDDANNARNRDLFAYKSVGKDLNDLNDYMEMLSENNDYTGLMEELYKKYDEKTAIRRLFVLIKYNIIENPSEFNIEHNLCRLVVEYSKFQRVKTRLKHRQYRKNKLEKNKLT